MRMTNSVQHFRLQSDQLNFWVEVRTLCHEDRCLAVALIAGDPEIGLGQTRQEAILDSLNPLGETASTLLAEAPSKHARS
jgi:hypothetical protein